MDHHDREEWEEEEEAEELPSCRINSTNSSSPIGEMVEEEAVADIEAAVETDKGREAIAGNVALLAPVVAVDTIEVEVMAIAMIGEVVDTEVVVEAMDADDAVDLWAILFHTYDLVFGSYIEWITIEKA